MMIRKGDGDGSGRGSGYGAKGRVVLERESAYIVEGGRTVRQLRHSISELRGINLAKNVQN